MTTAAAARQVHAGTFHRALPAFSSSRMRLSIRSHNCGGGAGAAFGVRNVASMPSRDRASR